MSDLGWRADGIARALAAGGVMLETYRAPGFARDVEVRALPTDSCGGGSGVYADPYPDEWDDEDE